MMQLYAVMYAMTRKDAISCSRMLVYASRCSTCIDAWYENNIYYLLQRDDYLCRSMQYMLWCMVCCHWLELMQSIACWWKYWFTWILWTSGMFSLLYNVCMLLRLVDVHGIVLCSQFHNLNWNTYSTFELLMISDASWWCMCHLMQKMPFIVHQWWH